ncbi:MAG: hypothetical protein WBA57_13605 [Elainellaceae cyanobacterium]
MSLCPEGRGVKRWVKSGNEAIAPGITVAMAIALLIFSERIKPILR